MSELTNLMSGIAGSIRGKTGESGKLRPAEFAGEIESINTVEIAEGSLGSVYLAEDASIRHDISDIREIIEDVPGLQPEAIWEYSGETISRMAVDSDGNTYYYTAGEHSLRKVNADGVQVWILNVESCNNITIDALGNIVFSAYPDTIVKLNPEGGELSRLKISNTYIGNMCIDADGNLYTDHIGSTGAGDSIYKHSPTGAYIWYITESDRVDEMSVSPDGNLYYSTWEAYHVKKIDSNGKQVFYTAYAGAYNTYRIFDISISRTGDIYCSHSGYQVFKIEKDKGRMTWCCYTGSNNTSNVISGSDNSVYMAIDGCIRKVNSRSETVWEKDVSDLSDFALDISENLYCACRDKTLRKFKNTTQLKKAVYCEYGEKISGGGTLIE